MSRQQKQHKAIARKYTGVLCDLELDADWPYECIAKDEHQDTHTVTICRSHMVWWHDLVESETLA